MKLTNIKFMILQIICERSEVSDYEIKQLVAQRNSLIRKQNSEEWSDTAFVDVDLKELKKKELVKSDLLLRRFAITEQGKKLLQQEILAALTFSRERDDRFDLAVVAIPLVALEKVEVALEKRKKLLAEAAEHIHTLFESQSRTERFFDLHSVSRHPLLVIKHEIEFIDVLLQEL
ncbi:DNA-binding PadR family transcriptional regulator [Sporomusaceae bacterium BoRhaA]|uniref:hypothetical protein n=1 Tax=Pelorhabdus rhamnosifermentans TaxID=2772457 RepID=UPI001C0608B4|nr:hypothetical protein [Pelorhabdus rhamnosifermentans]MBU2700953.1 DNA-binding PadR family transcriptional regulator [Pelorhabdus rhamnosifermentans]